MKNIYALIVLVSFINCSDVFGQLIFLGKPNQEIHLFNNNTTISSMSKMPRRSSFRWPWRAEKMSYFQWWGDKVGLRIIEGFEAKTGVRYFRQKSKLEYVADDTVLGGEIVIDTDLLNAVNLPGIIENRIKDIRIELPTGMLSRELVTWTSLARASVEVAGISIRGRYWSGALSNAQFPQPKDIGVLLDPEELVGIAAREALTKSILNNAVSLEVAVHPIQILTGFRKLEWASESGFYLGTDFSLGYIKSTDLTFKQGRELLGDIDMGQEIRDVLPDPLENLINTDEAGELLLAAAESRIPLYGFGLPIASGRTFELETWMGYQWANSTWSGDARLGFTYQTQKMTNDHLSNPVLSVSRWTPTINVKWVFRKDKTDSPLLGS